MRRQTKAYERALAEANKAFQETEEVTLNPEVLVVLVLFPVLAIPLLLLF